MKHIKLLKVRKKENPLQDSFVLTVKNVKEINETATTIKNMDHVAVIKYGESMVNELIKILIWLKILLLFNCCLNISYSFLIINTIKITILADMWD